MKRILLILFVLIGVIANAQVTPIGSGQPITQSISSDSGFLNIKGVGGGRLVVYRYTDTTAANTHPHLKNYPFALIGTTSDSSIWMRNPTANKWVLQVNSININELIVNTTNNVYNINDSTLVVCNGQGVCDTIHLGNSNTYYFINDSTVVTCDTPQVIQVGDNFVEQQLCDTISVPRQSLYTFQNGVQQISGGIVEHGNASNQPSNRGALQHDTWLNTNYFNYNITGYPILKPTLAVENIQGIYASGSVMSIKQKDGGNNDVGLYFNRTTPIWPVGLDTNGFMGRKKGSMIMTNAQGYWYSYLVDDYDAKQTGIMFHDKDTSNIDGVTIFAQQYPSMYSFGNTPSVDSNLLTKRVAVFKTNQQVQFPAYLQGAFEEPSPLYIIAQDDEGNLVQYPPGGLTPGSGLLFARDDARNNSGSSAYFSNAGLDFTIDSVATWAIFNKATGQTVTDRIFEVSNSGASFNTTSGTKTSFAGYFNNTASRSAGGNNLTNIGIYGTATGAQINYAAYFDGSVLADVSASTSSLVRITGSVSHSSILTVQDLSSNNLFRVAGTGQLFAENYGNGTFTGTAAYTLQVDASGNIIEGSAASGGATAYNGLSNAVTGTDSVLLGGTLVQNTTINTTSSYQLIISGDIPNSTAQGTVLIQNASNSSILDAALKVSKTNQGRGIQVNADQIGIASSSTSSNALFAQSVDNVAVYAQSTNSNALYTTTTATGVSSAQFTITPSTTNSVVPVIEIMRSTSGTAANGIGGSIDLLTEDAGGGTTLSNQLISKWTTAANATRTSQLDITGVTSASTETWLTLGQSGYMKLRGMNVTEAGAITAANGMIIYVTNTDATFTSVGFWGRENGAWVKL